jgi:hypothetical protein
MEPVLSGKIFEGSALATKLGFELLWSNGHFFASFNAGVKN